MPACEKEPSSFPTPLDWPTPDPKSFFDLESLEALLQTLLKESMFVPTLQLGH